MRTQIIGHTGAAAFFNPSPQALPLLHDLGFLGKPTARDRGDRDDDQQRAQAELKPSFLHRRIIPDGSQPELEVLAADSELFPAAGQLQWQTLPGPPLAAHP
jgi:hypothetical protein